MTTKPKYGHLVIISRSGADGKAFPMHYPRVLIGRKETCDIRMQKPQVSKEHCLVRIIDNQPVITNLSENCTLVNAHILGTGQQQVLDSGDIITIVGRSLRYEQPQKKKQRRLSGKIERKDTLFGSRPTHMLVNSRSLGYMDKETERRLKNWDRHYPGDANLNDNALEEDPFAITSSGGGETGEDVINRMKATIQRGLVSRSPMPDASTTAEFFSSLPRAPKLQASRKYASPLRRTVSTGGLRRKGSVKRNIFVPPPVAEEKEEEEEEEVPTEPEPESDHNEIPPTLPERQIIQQIAAMRKSVRFGPALSPEVFDSQAPPSTPPVKRGTPIRLARRASSILRNATPIRLFEGKKYRTTPYPSRKPAGPQEISDIESPTKAPRRKMKLSPLKRDQYREIDETDTRQAEPVMVVCTPKKSERRIRRDRRRTAPADLFKQSKEVASVEESMKEMARALGEDLPALFDRLPKKETENITPPPVLGLSEAMNTKAHKQPSDASLVSAQLSELRVSPKKSRGGPRRRQTVLGVFEPSKSLLSFEEEEDGQLEAQRKRRLEASQERRRQTVAGLKERRSSWRHMPGTLGPLIKDEHVLSTSIQQEQPSAEVGHSASANINMYPPKDWEQNRPKGYQSGASEEDTRGYPPPKQDIGEGWVEIDDSGKEAEAGADSQQVELHAASPVNEKQDMPPPNRELQSLLQSQDKISKEGVLKVGGHLLRNKPPTPKKPKPSRQSITPRARRKRRLSEENGTATRSPKRNKKN